MTPRFTVALWPTRGGLSDATLLGRLVWERTRDAVESLTGAKAVLVNGSAASPRGGRVLHLPAELPCLTARTVKRLSRQALDSREVGVFVGAPSPTGWAEGSRALAASVQRLSEVAADAADALWVRKPSDLAEAARILRERKRRALVSSGVLLEDPHTTLVDPEVEVARGARLCAFVLIEGTSRIGARAEIGRFTHIVDTSVGEGTVVLDHCFLRSSRVGRGVHMGPFTHLRPETNVLARAKIGNFVELKKTVVGRGSKVPHLTYLGDSIVGENVNVGAGTITCNYDGRSKHQTIIEDGAFIGSAVQLIAPVRVGRGAYVAAGSCIVADVPADSLALARSRQVVKPGWGARRRSRQSTSKQERVSASTKRR